MGNSLELVLHRREREQLLQVSFVCPYIPTSHCSSPCAPPRILVSAEFPLPPTSRWIWPMGIPGKRSEGRRRMRLRYLFLFPSSFWLLLSRKGPCFTVLYSSGFPVTSPSSGPFGSRCGNRSIGNSPGFSYIPCTSLYLVPLIILTCHLFTVEIQIQPINTL